MMKKLLLPILFVFVFITLKATELPLLNLEIGKTYHIETTTHIDTSAQWLHRSFDQRKWVMKPVNFENGIYSIDLVLDFYKIADQEKTDNKGWQELRSFESGYNMNMRTPLVSLNETKSPIKIQISTDGRIIDFDFSAYNNTDQISIDFEQYKSLYRKFTKEIQQLFFIVPSYDKENKWKSEVGEYTLVDENGESIQLDFRPHNKKGNETEFVSQAILIDKETGLVRREYFNYLVTETDVFGEMVNNGAKNNAMYFQKFVPVYSLKTKIFDSKYWEKEKNDSVNAVLKGTILNPIKGQDSVLIFISSYSYAFIPLDKNGKFEASFYLDNIQEMDIVYPINNEYGINERYISGSRYVKNACLIGLSGGDDIEIFMNYGASLKILETKGIGKEEFDLNKNWQKNDIEWINNNVRRIDVLNDNRNKIDPSVYLYCLFDLEYSNIKRPGHFDKDFPDKILVNNSLAINGYQYMSFLYDYIAKTMEGIIDMNAATKYGQQFNQLERNYFFGQYTLNEPIMSNYLFFCIYQWYFSFSNFELQLQLSESFNRNFSNSPLYGKFNFHNNKLMELAPGKPATDFQLKTIENESISLKKLRGKVVVLHFFNIYRIYDFYFFQSNIELDSSSIELNSNEIEFLNIFFDQRDSVIKLIDGDNKYGKIAIDDTYPNSKLYEIYQTNRGSNIYVIDRNGNIVSRRNLFRNWGILKSDLKKALAIPYKSENEFPVWLRIALIALTGALLSVVLAFIFYRNISKRRLQKSELNKKMRELELTAIRAQMNPHFMYNCLNSIQNLVQKQQNDQAHLYLSKFASLIRRTLNNSKKEEIALAEELETIQEYVDLEKLRFEFDYDAEIEPCINVHSIFVPPMLLQPFVENALLHGLLPKSPPRKLILKISQKENRVCIEIEDNGIGRSTAQQNGKPGNGRGLLLSKERLKLLKEKYKTGYHFEIVDLTDENGLPLGTRVSLCFLDE